MLVEKGDEALLGLLQNKVTRGEAFKLILNRYQQKLYYFLRKMGLTHEDADEVLQNVFIRFWKKTFDQKDGDQINLILYRLAVTGCLAYLQKQVAAASHGLPAQQQLIIILKQQEEFDFIEIAQIILLPVNEVRNIFKIGISEIYHQQNIKN